MYATGKTKWLCRQCFKHLSSKRSYDEHMNIHNASRPFACDQCDYSAASQMTLRRHKLRNHIPRQAWGYQCPYCAEAYMEPASYQQHVLIRHFGRSATFGCSQSGCTFTTKSSKHFKNHLKKHIFVMSVRAPSKCFTTKYDLSRYLIDDELGSGFGKPPLLPVPRRISALSLKSSAPSDSNQKPTEKRINVMVVNRSYLRNSINLNTTYLRKNVEIQTYPKELPELPPNPVQSYTLFNQKMAYSEPVPEYSSSDNVDWIETEVVVDDQPMLSKSNETAEIELD